MAKKTKTKKQKQKKKQTKQNKKKKKKKRTYSAFFQMIVFFRFCYVYLIFSLSMVQGMKIFMIT